MSTHLKSYNLLKVKVRGKIFEEYIEYAYHTSASSPTVIQYATITRDD